VGRVSASLVTFRKVGASDPDHARLVALHPLMPPLEPDTATCLDADRPPQLHTTRTTKLSRPNIDSVTLHQSFSYRLHRMNPRPPAQFASRAILTLLTPVCELKPRRCQCPISNGRRDQVIPTMRPKAACATNYTRAQKSLSTQQPVLRNRACTENLSLIPPPPVLRTLSHFSWHATPSKQGTKPG